jgi:hypothetical protein
MLSVQMVACGFVMLLYFVSAPDESKKGQRVFELFITKAKHWANIPRRIGLPCPQIIFLVAAAEAGNQAPQCARACDSPR